MSSHAGRNLLGLFRDSLISSLYSSLILLLLFTLSLAVYCSSISAENDSVTIIGAPEGIKHDVTTAFPFAGSPSADFTITAIGPVSFTSGSTATSNVIVTPENGFHSEVALTTTVSPDTGLLVSLSPWSLVFGSGISTTTFSSSIPRDYYVTITGISGSLSHTATLTVTVTAVGTPDFGISASLSSVNIQAGDSSTAMITVTPDDGFAGTVILRPSVSPLGPAATMTSSSISGGSGTSTVTIHAGSSVAAGPYTVTIEATSGNLAHSKSIMVIVTRTQDVMLSASAASLSFNSGASGMATITVALRNGFTGTITLAVTAPTGVSCELSPTSVDSSGASTLTCKGITAGDYAVMITATSGDSHFTTTVSVHVTAALPAAPAPSTTLGLSTEIFYGIVGTIIIVVFAGTVLVLRRSRPSGS